MGDLSTVPPLGNGASTSTGRLFSTYGTDYTDLGIDLSTRSCVSFQVTLCSWASLVLTTDPGNYSMNVYEFEFNYEYFAPTVILKCVLFFLL